MRMKFICLLCLTNIRSQSVINHQLQFICHSQIKFNNTKFQFNCQRLTHVTGERFNSNYNKSNESVRCLVNVSKSKQISNCSHFCRIANDISKNRIHLLNELLVWRRYISTHDFRCTRRCVIAWYFFRKSFSDSVDGRRSEMSRTRSKKETYAIRSFQNWQRKIHQINSYIF